MCRVVVLSGEQQSWELVHLYNVSEFTDDVDDIGFLEVGVEVSLLLTSRSSDDGVECVFSSLERSSKLLSSATPTSPSHNRV